MVHKLKPYGGVLVAPACRTGDTCNSIDLARLVRARLPRVLRHEVGHARRAPRRRLGGRAPVRRAARRGDVSWTLLGTEKSIERGC